MPPTGIGPSFQMTRAASRESMRPPANRLPKSRSVRVTGLTISSIPFMNRLSGKSLIENGCFTKWPT